MKASKLDEIKIDVAMSLLDCTVKIEDSKIRFRTKDCTIMVGE